MNCFCFDLQFFKDYNVVTIRGVINNVAVGDSFTVGDVTYIVLSVDTESGSVTASVNGTPVANLGKTVSVGEGKSIDGITTYTTDTTVVNSSSSITTKYNYSLNIGDNAIIVTINDNAIEKVVDASNNTLTETDGKYTISETEFALPKTPLKKSPSTTFRSARRRVLTLSTTKVSRWLMPTAV